MRRVAYPLCPPDPSASRFLLRALVFHVMWAHETPECRAWVRTHVPDGSFEVRKIMLAGDTTLVISLPKAFVYLLGAGAGDQLRITVRGDRLVLDKIEGAPEVP